MKIKYLITSAIIALTTITSCSNSPTHIVVAPEAFPITSNKLVGKSLSINVEDLRTAHHLLQINKKDQAAQLMNSQVALTNVVEKAIEQAFKQLGAQITPATTNQINITVANALINVDQELVKYKANNLIKINVTIDNGEQTLTKAFTNKGNSNGPLNADIAVLERDFSQQLAKLISQIASDEQVLSFLK